MSREFYPKKLAKTMIIIFVLFVVASGCGGSQQGSREKENNSGPSTLASTLPASTQQSPSQEHYAGLEVGESAEFENGLVATVEGVSLLEVPEALSEQLDPDDRLVDVWFSVENTNLEGQMPLRSFKVTTALWQARDQYGHSLQTLYPLETSLVAGELPNPELDHPYLGWQGELRPGQELQGSILFAAPSSTRMRVRFTQPVMNPPFGEWELGRVSELPRAP